jgi:hypothetical protein
MYRLACVSDIAAKTGVDLCTLRYKLLHSNDAERVRSLAEHGPVEVVGRSHEALLNTVEVSLTR